MAKELQIQRLDDWYKVRYLDIAERGGSGLLSLYGASPSAGIIIIIIIVVVVVVVLVVLVVLVLVLVQVGIGSNVAVRVGGS